MVLASCHAKEASGGAQNTPGAADSTRIMATLALMRTELKQVIMAQEAYFSEYNSYAPAFGSVQQAAVMKFVPTDQNVMVISNADPNGYTAVMTNPTLTAAPNTCGVFIGPPANAPNAAATQEAMPACW